ncbi:hypothetical protein [Brevundimonas sp. FT23042]|uniref:hypothetical protein n=1 Tax=Brevundimonas sp. FT23042 TaxID=3393749 RepID=UPI003B5889DB
MTRYGQLGLATALALGLTAGAANAQALQRGEVLGNWTLRLIPAEEGNVTISTDNGRLEMPVVVTARGGSAIACVADGEAADCRLDRGALVITLRMDDARMTYTLNGRRGGGFTGNARISYRLLPFGSMHLGTATLTRR